MTETSIVAQGYDAVYEAMPRSPTLLRIWKKEVAGDDYPDDFYQISFLTLPDLRQLGDGLALGKGSRFCDVACGMGGPALWLAQDREASLWGCGLLEDGHSNDSGQGLFVYPFEQYSTIWIA